MNLPRCPECGSPTLKDLSTGKSSCRCSFVKEEEIQDTGDFTGKVLECPSCGEKGSYSLILDPEDHELVLALCNSEVCQQESAVFFDLGQIQAFGFTEDEE